MKRVRQYRNEYGVSRRKELLMMRNARNQTWQNMNEPFANCMALLHWAWGGHEYMALEDKGALYRVCETLREQEGQPMTLLNHVFHFWQQFTAAVDAAHQLGGIVPEHVSPQFLLRYLPLAVSMLEISTEPADDPQDDFPPPRFLGYVDPDDDD
ncbi:hypothetical protein [Paraburkholderia sp. C35]|uniref:hypothetical protein n=1 Tax=Paraburkholderia sp. C35 TaxID=2126993 RepID=UPI000D691816|nr:hypothetical protein [Paraburkholderia sp. C35]